MNRVGRTWLVGLGMLLATAMVLSAIVIAFRLAIDRVVVSDETGGEGGVVVPRRVELSLAPGDSMRVPIDRAGGSPRVLVLEIPEAPSESFSIGTLRVRFEDEPPTVERTIERDGSPSALWIAEVTGDGRIDGLLVVRSAGSGNYPTLVLLDDLGGAAEPRRLPDPTREFFDRVTGSRDYLGHDVVEIDGNVIVRRFPTYHRGGLRVDPAWKPSDLVRGDGPLATHADANAAPTGPTVEIAFDVVADAWRPH